MLSSSSPQFPKLNSHNYNIWFGEMQAWLHAQGVWHIVAATSLAPKLAATRVLFPPPHNLSTLPCPIDSRWTPLDSTWTHGVHLESMWIFIGRGPSQIFSKVHLEFTWTPDGLQMDHMDSVESTPLHLPDIIFSRLHVDSKWTPII
jgi:hypothetical protein